MNKRQQQQILDVYWCSGRWGLKYNIYIIFQQSTAIEISLTDKYLIFKNTIKLRVDKIHEPFLSLCVIKNNFFYPPHQIRITGLGLGG